MDKKKILIVSRSFYPLNSPRSHRTTELAKEFAREGHEVTVLIPKDEKIHLAFEREHHFTIKDLGTLRWKSTDFGKSRIGYVLTRAAYRFMSLAFEYPAIELMFLVAKALKKESGYDLLISIAVPYPIHWGVAMVWKKNQKIARTWVADCGDPYMGNKLDTFNKWFYFKYVEKWFMRKADYITITNINFKVNYYKEFHSKMFEIPQGFKFDDVKLYNGKVKNIVPHFAFAGGVFPGYRDPTKFLSYLISLSIDFKFILYTRTVDIIKPYALKSDGRIEIRDYIPRTNLLYELSKMDFLVNFEFNPLIQSPSKLIDYGIAERPILNIIAKEFNPSIIDEFLKGDYSNKFEIPNIDQYRIENVCAAFLALSK
jgi:hypothetical protein